jgi:hypothetical protein
MKRSETHALGTEGRRKGRSSPLVERAERYAEAIRPVETAEDGTEH